ncbi:MAG: GGDEF domain-containing protein, partial [Comamonadaceae bacterium]
LRFDRRVLQGEAAASPYARQLMAGFPRLLFDAPLECEYADHVHDAQRRAALACGWLALAMWVGWAGISAHSPAAPMWWLARSVVALALGAGIYLFSTRRFFVRTDVVAFVILLPLAVATVVHAFMRPGAGLPQGQFAALLLIVAAFFPIGLLLVQSLTAVMAVVLGGAVTAWLALPADTYGATLRLSALLLSTAGVAAVGAYFREHSHRELFLLHELLSRQAHIDPLTGLQNRRGSDHLTQIARLQAIREGVSLSFVVVEIDDPGRPPDRAGHEPAEAMLMQVTKVLSAFARRPLDVTTRLDGHTFGLLLYDCKLEQARQHAQRLQEALGALD